MDRSVIEKYQNNPLWSEVIKLYSGLFSNEDDRSEFVLDLAESNVLLAAQCKNTSIEEETNISEIIKKISYHKALYFDDFKGSAKAFEALLQLDGLDEVLKILNEIKVPTKIHKMIINEFVNSSIEKELIPFIANVIKNDTKQNKNILDWTFKELPNRNISEVDENNSSAYLSIIDNLKINKNRSELLITLYIGNFLSVFKLIELRDIVNKICSVLSKTRSVDKGQYNTVGKLVEIYDINSSVLSIEVTKLNDYQELREQEKIKISDEIKKSLLDQTVSCKIQKMQKVLDGRLNYIPVTILNLKSQPRGIQFIALNELPLLNDKKSGDIIFAKVVNVKYGQGDIILSINTFRN